MRDYDIKRGHFKNIEGKIETIAEEVFGEFEKTGEKIITSFGALKKLEFWLEGKTKLWVDTEMEKDVDDSTAMETHKRYNGLLLRLTGYTAKQRAKRVKDKAKKGRL
ncbi:MAG: DUF5611 family protein [Thermoplasmata archaeon]|nr:DUF5611 family protein [Thermoplasmata archaeon]